LPIQPSSRIPRSRTGSPSRNTLPTSRPRTRTLSSCASSTNRIWPPRRRRRVRPPTSARLLQPQRRRWPSAPARRAIRPRSRNHHNKYRLRCKSPRGRAPPLSLLPRRPPTRRPLRLRYSATLATPATRSNFRRSTETTTPMPT